MNKILYLCIFSLLFGAIEAQADAGYDPTIYDSEEEADNNLFSIIPPTPIKIGKPSSSNTTTKSTPNESATNNITKEDSITIPDKPAITNITPTEEKATDTTIEPTATTSDEPVAVENIPSESVANVPTVTTSSQTDTVPEDFFAINDAPISSEPIEDEESDNSLEKLMSSSRRGKKRTNASVFDISGVMLRMTLVQVEDALKSRKFTKVAEKFEIPNFIKWRNEEKCRNNGVVGYERLNSCVVSLSKQAGHQNPETVKFARFDTKEEIIVKLTSNFSNNKVYLIYYSSLAPSITGNSAKASYLRNIKVYDFWKKINRKYGTPDNKDEIIWGLGGNKPYLKASSGKLVLEDPILRELDYTRMSREDQRFMNTDLFNF